MGETMCTLNEEGNLLHTQPNAARWYEDKPRPCDVERSPATEFPGKAYRLHRQIKNPAPRGEVLESQKPGEGERRKRRGMYPP